MPSEVNCERTGEGGLRVITLLSIRNCSVSKCTITLILLLLSLTYCTSSSFSPLHECLLKKLWFIVLCMPMIHCVTGICVAKNTGEINKHKHLKRWSKVFSYAQAWIQKGDLIYYNGVFWNIDTWWSYVEYITKLFQIKENTVPSFGREPFVFCISTDSQFRHYISPLSCICTNISAEALLSYRTFEKLFSKA